MLILRRKEGQSIVLPRLNVVLTVVRVRGNNVRLGISAPLGMEILREEIWERSKASALSTKEGATAAKRRVRPGD